MKAPTAQIANTSHKKYAEQIAELIMHSAHQRGTGIAKRTPEYISTKIEEGKAIIALSENHELVGFCYIESWGNKAYVANSGLIVNPDFRGMGIAKQIKKKAFEHSRKLFPEAKLFGLTTSLPVMKINSELGYVPVIYDQLTDDDTFWKGCHSCVNYEILKSKNKKNCICTAMIYEPDKKTKKWAFLKNLKVYERFMRLKKRKAKTEL